MEPTKFRVFFLAEIADDTAYVILKTEDGIIGDILNIVYPLGATIPSLSGVYTVDELVKAFGGVLLGRTAGTRENCDSVMDIIKRSPNYTGPYSQAVIENIKEKLKSAVYAEEAIKAAPYKPKTPTASEHSLSFYSEDNIRVNNVTDLYEFIKKDAKEQLDTVYAEILEKLPQLIKVQETDGSPIVFKFELSYE